MPPDPFYAALPTPTTLADGIFKGGGTAGIVYVGSLAALARHGIWFKRTAGTSAGAITAAIIAAGYDANEIDYLSAPRGVRAGPPAGFPSGAEPLDYLSLLDIPLSPGEVTLDTRRNNLIYHAIRGPAVDELLKLSLPLPTLEPFITRIVNDVMSVIPRQVGPFKVKVGPFEAKAGPFKVKVLGQKVKVGPWTIDTPRYEVQVGPFPVPVSTIRPLVLSAVRGVLEGYPKALKLAEAGLLAAEDLKRVFSDAVMSTLLITNPLLVIYLNFMGDGGLFKGDAFLRAITRILEAKVGRSPRFVDLPLEFACTACNATERSLEVYSRRTSPDMEVAEAVRRSMSIPFFFEPRRDRGNEVMDGGVIDNFPVGFFLSRKNAGFENSDLDMARVKLGFVPGPSGLGPPMEVERMLAQYLPSTASLPLRTVELTGLDRAVNAGISNMQDSPLLEAMLRELKHVSKFYEVSGGLEDHSATDFNITPVKWRRMCRKGWSGAIQRIDEGVSDGNLALATPLDGTNPY